MPDEHGHDERGHGTHNLRYTHKLKYTLNSTKCALVLTALVSSPTGRQGLSKVAQRICPLILECRFPDSHAFAIDHL